MRVHLRNESIGKMEEVLLQTRLYKKALIFQKSQKLNEVRF